MSYFPVDYKDVLGADGQTLNELRGVVERRYPQDIVYTEMVIGEYHEAVNALEPFDPEEAQKIASDAAIRIVARCAIGAFAGE